MIKENLIAIEFLKIKKQGIFLFMSGKDSFIDSGFASRELGLENPFLSNS